MSRKLRVMRVVPPTRSSDRSSNHPQQLALNVKGQGVHLVQKEGAVMGQLKTAPVGAQGIGEGALLMAEQLRWESGFRSGTQC